MPVSVPQWELESGEIEESHSLASRKRIKQLKDLDAA
jgi:hypothetical protein